jgi:2-polyprenyl-6-methoxyphenol hydroxylase-like FAD-dependent oxidoreductase
MSSKSQSDVLIIGGGIGGLVLALSLHQKGIACRIFESVREIRAVGAGINLLPHAVRELDALGLQPALTEVGILTKDASYFNQYGQHIYTEPAGMSAGYKWPQISIHRGDLHEVLLQAVRSRLGVECIKTGHHCVGVEQNEESITARFVDASGAALPPAAGAVVIGCDGIHSVLRSIPA